jgi:hypothetical protein
MAEQFDLGRHDALIEQLVKGQEAMQKDIEWIKTRMAEQRGERRVALWAASAGGGLLVTISGFVAKKLGL